MWAASSGRPSPRVTASACAAKASFNSIVSKSPIFRLRRVINFCVADTGPMPMTRGATPAVAIPSTRARGRKPCFSKATSDATIKVAEAATLAAAGTPGAPAAKAAEETVKATAASTMGSMITGVAGGADIHACATPLPLPPHGPGVVIDGSLTVLINGLPACRQGDTIIEAVGPPDKIALGCPTVIIGDVPNAIDSLVRPALDAIANDPAVMAAINSAWNASNPDGAGARQENGFWVVRDDATGQLSTVPFPTNGTRDSMVPGAPPNNPGQTTVAFVHTHPNTDAEGYRQQPSDADTNFANANGVPGIIRSHNGMYYFP